MLYNDLYNNIADPSTIRGEYDESNPDLILFPEGIAQGLFIFKNKLEKKCLLTIKIKRSVQTPAFHSLPVRAGSKGQVT